MKGLGLAFGASLVAIGGVAGGCGGAAFMSGGDAGSGSTVDAGIEASAEAGDASEAAAPPVDAGMPWCTGHTETFCEDFDEYSSITTMLGSNTWPVFSQTNGSFQFDSVNAPSPPNALEVMGGDDGANVLIVHTFTGLPASPMTLRLDFDLRVNNGGTAGLLSVAGFAAIALGASISDGYVAMAIGDGPTLGALWAQSTTTTFGDAGTGKVVPTSGAFPSPGVWNGSYAVEIDYGATASGCLQVYRGATPLLMPCLMLPSEFASPHVVSIALGDVAGGAAHTGMIDLEFDNVTFNIK
jgi:hypothetical protein